jgi:membrane dipeptidase
VWCTGRPTSRRRTASGVPALWLCREGGDFAEGRLDGIAEVHAAGVRSITLVHHRVNELGDIETAPPAHDGLSAFGREWRLAVGSGEHDARGFHR